MRLSRRAVQLRDNAPSATGRPGQEPVPVAVQTRTLQN